VTAFALGCGSKEQPPSPAATGEISASTIASFEGTYRLDAATKNATGCDADGGSVLAMFDELNFVIVGGTADDGLSYLQLDSCYYVSDCFTKAQGIAEANTLIGGEYFVKFTSVVSADELAGPRLSGGYAMDGACRSRTFESNSLVRAGDAVRIETRNFTLPDAPTAADGTCPPDAKAQEAEAKEQPCNALATFNGTKTGPLPFSE